MPRLPQVGGDTGNWGDILNDYLSQSLKSDGSIKDNAITASAIADGSITTDQLADNNITEIKLSSQIRAKLDSINNSMPYGLSIGSGLINVPVSYHTSGAFVDVTNGTTATSMTSETFHELSDPSVLQVLPIFANWNASLGDSASPNSITVAAAVKCSDGTILPFTFNGQHTVTILPGAVVTPDAPRSFGSQVTATRSSDFGGASRGGVFIRTYVQVTGGQRWPNNINFGWYSQEKRTSSVGGADLTLAGSVAPPLDSTATGYVYGPAVVLGRPLSRKPIVAVIGDSQMAGIGEVSGTAGLLGYPTRALNSLGYPMLKLAVSGERASHFSTDIGRQYRAGLLEGCTHAVVDYGTNDLAAGSTVTDLQNNLLTIHTFLSRIGIKSYQLTITPRTTSTDSWATPGNQTSVFTANSLNSINDWIRTTPSPMAGFIDINETVSSSHNSGAWKAGYTADGVHQSGAGITACAATLQSAMSNWSV